jgi:hypothetical protein
MAEREGQDLWNSLIDINEELVKISEDQRSYLRDLCAAA